MACGLLAVVCGTACHNTTLGGNDYEISGDYAGHAQRLVEEQHPGAQAMFVLGCAGDANPYPRGTHEIAATHGKELAKEVERVLTTKLVPVRGPLKIAFGEASLEGRHVVVQGVGKVGSGVARRLKAEGARVTVADSVEKMG